MAGIRGQGQPLMLPFPHFIHLDRNTERLSVETERLAEHTKRACRCWIWFIVLVVSITFVGKLNHNHKSNYNRAPTSPVLPRRRRRLRGFDYFLNVSRSFILDTWFVNKILHTSNEIRTSQTASTPRQYRMVRLVWDMNCISAGIIVTLALQPVYVTNHMGRPVLQMFFFASFSHGDGDEGFSET